MDFGGRKVYPGIRRYIVNTPFRIVSLRYLHCLTLPVGIGRLPTKPIAYPALLPPQACAGLQNDGGGLDSGAIFLRLRRALLCRFEAPGPVGLGAAGTT